MQAPYQCLGGELQFSPLVGPWPRMQPRDFRLSLLPACGGAALPTTWSKAWPYDLLPPKEPERSGTWPSQEMAWGASVCFITGAGPVAAFRSDRAELRSRGPCVPGWLRAQPGTTGILGLLITTASPTVSWWREKDTTSVLPVIPLFSPPLKRTPGPLGAERPSFSLYLGVGVRVGGDAVLNKENLHRVEISRKGFQEHIPFLSPRSKRDAGVGELIMRMLRKKAEEPRWPRGGRLQPWLREALPLTFLAALGHSPQPDCLLQSWPLPPTSSVNLAPKLTPNILV